MSLTRSNESSAEPRVAVSNNDCSIKFYDINVRGSKGVDGPPTRISEVGTLKLDVAVNHCACFPPCLHGSKALLIRNRSFDLTRWTHIAFCGRLATCIPAWPDGWLTYHVYTICETHTSSIRLFVPLLEPEFELWPGFVLHWLLGMRDEVRGRESGGYGRGVGCEEYETDEDI